MKKTPAAPVLKKSTPAGKSRQSYRFDPSIHRALRYFSKVTDTYSNVKVFRKFSPRNQQHDS